MREWPQEAFAELGLRNPFEPTNITIRREALAATSQLSGALVQCGVFQGGSLAPLVWLLREWKDPRHAFACDSFGGFPPPTPNDKVNGEYLPVHQPAYFSDTSGERVRGMFEGLGLGGRVTLVQGYFEDTLPTAHIGEISVLILDCDLYEAYLTCLETLYPSTQPGGWIIFDEYHSPGKYPGAKIAVDEFFADKPEKLRLATHLLAEHPYERWYVIKQ